MLSDVPEEWLDGYRLSPRSLGGSSRQNAPYPGFVADVYGVNVRLDTQTFYPGTGTGDEAQPRYSIQYANTNKGVLKLDV